MEEEIRELERQGKVEQADALTLQKNRQRVDHLEGGAENTRFILQQLKDLEILLNHCLNQMKSIDV